VTDAELVGRARQGDAAAFGELVDRHRTAVYRAARAALGSAEEAEDAAQDAFLSAYRRLNSFRGEASFKTWLLTIAWHHAINRRRSLTRIWRRLVEPVVTDAGSVSAMDSVAADGPTPEDHAVRRQLEQAIEHAIAELRPKLKDALLLARSGIHSYEEISGMLSVPLGTIKWRVSEARRLVKMRLRERGYGDVAERR